MNGDIHSIILIIIAIVEFILGFYILIRKQGEIARVYGLFVFGVIVWVLSLGLELGLKNLDYAFLASNFTYVAAACIASIFVYFSLVFPFKTRPLKKLDFLAIISPGIIVLLLILFTDLLTKELIVHDWGRETTLGAAYHFYSIYFLGFMTWGLVNLFKKYKISDGVHRWQIKYFLWGIIISLAFGLFFDLILPWFGNYKLVHIGAEASIVWLGFTSYIILKK